MSFIVRVIRIDHPPLGDCGVQESPLSVIEPGEVWSNRSEASAETSYFLTPKTFAWTSPSLRYMSRTTGVFELFVNFMSIDDQSSVDSRDRKSTRLNSSHVAISYAVI